MIRPTITYRFETDYLIGEIRPDLPKAGVVLCRHKPSGFELLPEPPLHALLMPEWLMRPGQRREGIFWNPCWARPDVRVEGEGVVFHVPATQTREWNIDVTFRYAPGPDWIDLSCTLVPGSAIDDFEFFFASYINEAMERTYVSAALPDGESWQWLDNRKTKPYGPPYFIVRDERARQYLEDGRWHLGGNAREKGLEPDWYYARPILLAMQESTGLAAVTLVEPQVCTLLGGQHHHVETAHDFTFSGHLRPQEPLVGRARVVIRKIGQFPQASAQLDTMWTEFIDALKEGGVV
ncbi:MAG: hypothetical protein HY710_16655 [Candidatus Latescibacteria bacterium]|nr:hypothetical protein [Candidatus Latescibacterota bacterium]